MSESKEIEFDGNQSRKISQAEIRAAGISIPSAHLCEVVEDALNKLNSNIKDQPLYADSVDEAAIKRIAALLVEIKNVLEGLDEEVADLGGEGMKMSGVDIAAGMIRGIVEIFLASDKSPEKVNEMVAAITERLERIKALQEAEALYDAQAPQRAAAEAERSAAVMDEIGGLLEDLDGEAATRSETPQPEDPEVFELAAVFTLDQATEVVGAMQSNGFYLRPEKHDYSYLVFFKGGLQVIARPTQNEAEDVADRKMMLELEMVITHGNSKLISMGLDDGLPAAVDHALSALLEAVELMLGEEVDGLPDDKRLDRLMAIEAAQIGLQIAPDKED